MVDLLSIIVVQPVTLDTSVCIVPCSGGDETESSGGSRASIHRLILRGPSYWQSQATM